MLQEQIVIFSYKYPPENDNIFLSNELPFLLNAFKKVVIITKESKKGHKKTHDNIDIFEYKKTTRKTKLISYFIKSFFSSIFRNEIKYIKTKPKPELNKKRIKSALIDLQNASAISSFLEQNLTLRNYNTIIYSFWADNFAIGSALLKRNNPKEKINVNVRAHGWDIYDDRNELYYQPFRGFLFGEINNMILISKHGKSYLKNEFPHHKNKFKVSYLGTHPHNNIKPRDNFNGNNCFHIYSCSHVNQVKRIDLIVKALSEYKGSKTIKWTHIGYAELFDEIKLLSDKLLNEKTNVVFEFKGELSNTDVLDFLKNENIDFLINTSKSEGLPVSMMEAMSFGIPVIGTDVGGVSEIVIDKENGFLLNANPSSTDIIQKIEEIIGLSLEKRKSLSKNAVEHWKKNFNGIGNSEKLIDILRAE